MTSQWTPASSPLLSGQIPGGVLYGIHISKTLFGITKKKKKTFKVTLGKSLTCIL